MIRTKRHAQTGRFINEIQIWVGSGLAVKLRACGGGGRGQFKLSGVKVGESP